MKLADLNSFLASYPGGVSIEEGLALGQYAEQCLNNVIVEIGSFKGKSAVALASGQALGCFAETGLVYCVEPHLPELRPKVGDGMKGDALERPFSI